MTLFLQLALLTPPVPGVLLQEPVEIEAAEEDESEPEEYGPFFEAEAPSDTQFNTRSRKGNTPALSVGGGSFCFVEGSWCKASLILSASVAAGMRIPASDEGPDIPFAQFTFRGGAVIRPFMLSRRKWHPWGLGLIGSWSRGTGAITIRGDSSNQEVDESESATTVRVQGLNQLWLSKKNHGIHLDFAIGAAQSNVLTSGYRLWGSSAEVGLGWGGWGGAYVAGDFLDRDTRVVFGFRGHGIAAAPIIALALAGLALGGGL